MPAAADWACAWALRCSGRKKAALIYVVTYALSCATKHSPDYGILMVRPGARGGGKQGGLYGPPVQQRTMCAATHSQSCCTAPRVHLHPALDACMAACMHAHTYAWRWRRQRTPAPSQRVKLAAAPSRHTRPCTGMPAPSQRPSVTGLDGAPWTGRPPCSWDASWAALPRRCCSALLRAGWWRSTFRAALRRSGSATRSQRCVREHSAGGHALDAAAHCMLRERGGR